MDAEHALRRLVDALRAVDKCGQKRPSSCMAFEEMSGDKHGAELRGAIVTAERCLEEIDAIASAKPILGKAEP